MADDIWMVVAVIQPFKLDPVTVALEEVSGFRGMTVTDCRGFGQEKLSEVDAEGSGDSPAERRRSSDADLIDFTRKVKVEIAVLGRPAADLVIEAILTAAHTGRRGDGKIFAWPLSRVVGVRTHEEGAGAL